MIFRALVASLLLAAFLLILSRPFTKDWQRAGLVSSLGLILFFSFGSGYSLLKEQFGPSFRENYLLTIYVGVFVLGSWFLIEKLADTQKVTSTLMVASLTLLLFPLMQLGSYWISTLQANIEARELTKNLIPLTENLSQQEHLPDIYYIVLDAYASAETLKQYSDYDNEPFLQELRNLGFYVATCSQSNYSTTYHSLTSSFYLDYADKLVDSGTILPSLKESTLVQTLDIHGYHVVAFENTAEGQLSLKENVRLSKNISLLRGISLTRGLNEFEIELVNKYLIKPLSGFSALTDRIPFLDDPKRNEYFEHYLQTVYILDSLPQLQHIAAPKLVLVHLLVPHDPYIFTPDGEFIYADSIDHGQGYGRNVEFLNSRLIPILNSIIEQSKIPPIIILQGDHGPKKSSTPEQRMTILNAYYLNQEAENQLYPSISPVNSFRLILNTYFGTDYTLLEDISYYLPERNFRLDREFRNAKIIPNLCENTLE